MYANGDSFFGHYSADKRSGQGLYVFAKGGVHAGQRQQGSMPCQPGRPACVDAASLDPVIMPCALASSTLHSGGPKQQGLMVVEL